LDRTAALFTGVLNLAQLESVRLAGLATLGFAATRRRRR
jgi:hypothetical protein